MLTPTTASPVGRAVRRYHVFFGAEPVLSLESRPGRLYSMARLPEGATAPGHPFIDGVSHHPVFEHRLRELLLASEDFDAFVGRLVADGFDLAANDGDAARAVNAPGVRLCRDGVLVAALWDSPGQLSSLRWQPPAGELSFDHATLTAYDPAIEPELRDMLQKTQTFDDLFGALSTEGFAPCG